jgi:glucosamine--fructose-6-phosphate aminotransferase (isomerizing)
MAEPHHESAMAREIAEIPGVVSRLLTRTDLFAALAERINRAKPRIVVFCGRGSSGHVGVYLRYLFEARLGMLASAAAPSVMTVYKQVPAMHDALFVVISQSGHSPDIVMATQRAREFGALTLAIVNDSDSPAAAAAELILPIDAGVELSVAATKSVVLSMIAGARLVAALAPDHDLDMALKQLPQRLSGALACDWSIWADTVAESTAAFVVGRGYGLGCAREIALKVCEILRIPALGYSAAELQHGPRASISSATPVLALRQNDQAARTVEEFVSGLSGAAGKVFAAGGAAGTLPWIGDGHPICDPIVMLVPAYRAIESAARRRGFDPDKPPYLSKVTRTF